MNFNKLSWSSQSKCFIRCPTPSFSLVLDGLGTHSPHSSEDQLWRKMAGFPGSRVAQRASEFYSSVMLNKKQWILGARALNFLQSVRQLMAGPGP